MDVTFRESEPFYGGASDLSGLFQGLDHLGDAQEGKKQIGNNGFNSSKVVTNNINKFLL